MNWLAIILEILLFVALGLGYYTYQKRKIIKNAKEDLRFKLRDLLKKNSKEKDSDKIDQLLINQQYFKVLDEIKSFDKCELKEQISKDLVEMNKYI